MAEKEERTKDIIYVFSQELICKNCKDWYEHIDPLDKTDCDNCEDIADLPHISRQEAINRMAKAIWETGYNEVLNISFDELKTKSHKSKSTNFGNFYKLTVERAEAALNALLDGGER